jgi:hypothetical protein
MEDETITIDTRPRRSAVDAATECRRVALIGARGMSFHVSGARGSDDPTFHLSSVAGLLELHGCGPFPDTVSLKADSGRGALETVVARSSGTRGLAPASSILLERTGGAVPPPPDPGPLPPLPPARGRAVARQAEDVANGWSQAELLEWTAGEDGKGGRRLLLPEGCHRFDLFTGGAEAGGHGVRMDLDGALRRDRDGGELIAEDQGSAPDVHLSTCVGTATRMEVTFEGAQRRSAVLVSHTSRPLPLHLPGAWSAELRGRLASALVTREVPALREDAVMLSRGGAGRTPVSLPMEPGGCYVIAAVVDRGRGRSRGVGLSVTPAEGGRTSHDEAGGRATSALVAFCAEGASEARVVVDARSSTAVWALAAFRVASHAFRGGE